MARKRYQVSRKSPLALSVDSTVYVQGEEVPISKLSKGELVRLKKEGILEELAAQPASPRPKRQKTTITSFQLDPKELDGMSLESLQALLVERGVDPLPKTVGGCIAYLSRDHFDRKV
jgi:hypothetical protein